MLCYYIIYHISYITGGLPLRQAAWACCICSMRLRLVALQVNTVDFRNFIVFVSGRDPGTLKSDIVSKKHPQSICSDLKLSN